MFILCCFVPVFLFLFFLFSLDALPTNYCAALKKHEGEKGRRRNIEKWRKENRETNRRKLHVRKLGFEMQMRPFVFAQRGTAWMFDTFRRSFQQFHLPFSFHLVSPPCITTIVQLTTNPAEVGDSVFQLIIHSTAQEVVLNTQHIAEVFHFGSSVTTKRS